MAVRREKKEGIEEFFDETRRVSILDLAAANRKGTLFNKGKAGGDKLYFTVTEAVARAYEVLISLVWGEPYYLMWFKVYVRDRSMVKTNEGGIPSVREYDRNVGVQEARLVNYPGKGMNQEGGEIVVDINEGVVAGKEVILQLLKVIEVSEKEAKEEYKEGIRLGLIDYYSYQRAIEKTAATQKAKEKAQKRLIEWDS